MALTTDRKLTILVIGVLAVGVILGLFFGRMGDFGKRRSADSLIFSTQSVHNGTASSTARKQEIPCPWDQEIIAEKEVLFTNPLLEKSHDIMGIKKGMITQNYPMYGPVGADEDQRKATFVSQKLDGVEAKIRAAQGICHYKSDGKDLFILRQDLPETDCYVVNTMDLVGFSCAE